MAYVPYHVHTHYSLLDSCTKPAYYIQKAKETGAAAIAFTEHGNTFGWMEKYVLCKEAGIKFIFGAEVYLTESLDEKLKDNYHTILLAKNKDGFRELNRLLFNSTDPEHRYYKPRISFDEFLGISENIISTSACLASPLRKLDESNPYFEKLVMKYSFLEVQPHISDAQKLYNQKLIQLSEKYNKPLIAAGDFHAVNTYYDECRNILMDDKGQHYEDEDLMDLVYKTEPEMRKAFKEQNILNAEQIESAIAHTGLLAVWCEDLDFDTTFKYPILYGSRQNDIKKLRDVCAQMFLDKIKKGVIPKEQQKQFGENIRHELEVFKKLGMSGFMLSMSEIISWCKQQGLAIGVGRGSVGSSCVAYVTDIDDINPVRWGTIFSRFANEDRVVAADIDVDVRDSDKPKIFNYIAQKFGREKVGRVLAYTNLKEKGAIRLIGRVLAKRYKSDATALKDNPYSLKEIEQICKLYDEDPQKTRKKFKNLFYYFDGIVDTKISLSVHPGGIVISNINLLEECGLFYKDDEILVVLDMEEAHSEYMNLIKYDFLSSKTLDVISETCSLAGIPFPKSHELNLDDPDVWESIGEDGTCIFQFEEQFAQSCLKKMKPKNLEELALLSAALRPAAGSFRESLVSRKPHINLNPQMDELLKKNNGYMVYQEDVTKILMSLCKMSGSKADTVRRGIASKNKQLLESMFPEIIEGYCANSDKPREEAEKEAKSIIQVIEDSSNYGFNYSHAVAYGMIGYIMGYLRYYHPVEFAAAFMNYASNEDDIKNGTSMAQSRGIKVILPKWGISKADYFFNKESKIIAQGLKSIKYLNAEIADLLFDVSQKFKFDSFMDLMNHVIHTTSLNRTQMEILIKINYFSDFGDQKKLLRLFSIYFELLNKGSALQISRSKVAGTPLEKAFIQKCSGLKKDGTPAKFYKVENMSELFHEIEKIVLEYEEKPTTNVEKALYYNEALGFPGFVSGEQKDRPYLLIMNVTKAKRKSDNKTFGYNVHTKSIGSGVECRMTIFSNVYKKNPVKEGDVIYLPVNGCTRNGSYWNLNRYKLIHSK